MFKTGDIIDGRYEIKEQIGSGGGGIIYKAYNRNIRKDVALKLIKDASAEELENRSEIDLMKDLKSKYLPTFYDFARNGDEVYTVMEYIDGHDIKRLIELGKTFSEEEIIKCGIQLCEAAGELHSKRPPIIHGDIKPANVMITAAGNVCLIDFNISAIMQGSKAAVKGYSKEYAAPEQTFTSKNYKQYVENPIEDEFHEETRFLLSEAAEKSDTYTRTLLDNEKSPEKKESAQAFIDIRTDIFGIGAVLYYMLTGHPPVNGQPDFSDADVSVKLKRIIAKAMSADPSERYKDTNEMKDALYSKERELPEKARDTKEKAKIIGGIACAAAAVAIIVAVAVNGKNDSVRISDAPNTSSEHETMISVKTDTDDNGAITESSDTVAEEYSFECIGKETGFRDTLWGMNQDEVKLLETLELVGQDDSLLVYLYPKDMIKEIPMSSLSNAIDNVALSYVFNYAPVEGNDTKYDLDGLYQIMFKVYFDSEELRDSDYPKLVEALNDEYGDSESEKNNVGVINLDNQKTWTCSNNSYITTYKEKHSDTDKKYSIVIGIYTNDYTVSTAWKVYDDINSISDLQG